MFKIKDDKEVISNSEGKITKVIAKLYLISNDKSLNNNVNKKLNNENTNNSSNDINYNNNINNNNIKNNNNINNLTTTTTEIIINNIIT